MKFAKPQGRMAKVSGALSLLAVAMGSLVAGQATGQVANVPTRAPVKGEIERIVIDDPADHWSGGHIVVSGKTIILPRNLLLDLPANRLTLKQLFDQAPADCLAAGETGLAKSDTCNHTGFGGIAAISANKTTHGNVIAGDVLIAKGEETITGRVTYINHDEGYLRLNGVRGDATTGVMVRMNDPSSRHTIQKGLGCAASSVDSNCSPDPRFGLDTDNYTNASSTGFPTCIPSTTPRDWAGLIGQDTASPAVAGGPTASDAAGIGDALCPSTNRTPDFVVADSRRFAPVQLDDNLEVEGNWETIDGTKFLSYHTSTLMVALATKTALSQPDYLMPEEVFVETGDFQNFRIRSLIIGFSTLTPDILLHGIHYDPTTNSKHLKPLATTAGCDAVAGAGTCSAAGLLGAVNVGPAGGNIFRIRYDVDFLIGARDGLDPCAMLRADSRMGPAPCPNWTVTGRPALYNATTIAEMFAVLSPTPHEVQFYTGHHHAAQTNGITQTTVDILGHEATNGQYLYPFGVNLGGVEWSAEWSEINLAAFQTPFAFTSIPWNLDRRLSPNGCLRDAATGEAQCETTPQPLDPFPFEAMDPREQTNGCAGLAGAACELPNVPYNDPVFTASGLSTVRDRVLSYIGDVPATATTPAHQDFNGDATVLDWPPADPPAIAEPAEVPLTFCGSTLATGCAGTGTQPQIVYNPPVAVATGPLAAVNAGSTVTLSGAQSADGNNPALTLLYAWAQTGGPTVVISGAATASPTFTAPLGAADSVLTFVLTVSNGHMTSTAAVDVNVNAVTAPTAAAAATPSTVNAGSTVTLSGAGSADTNSPAVLNLTYAWTKVSPATPNVTISGATTASPTFSAPPVATQTVFTFQNTVSNGYKTASATTTVTVNPVAPRVTVAGKTANVNTFTTLPASASTVAGQALTYSWRQVSGTTVVVTGASTSTLNFTTPSTAGSLVFEVTVTDSVGLTATAQATVTVSANVLRAAAFFYTSQNKWQVWANNSSATLTAITASWQDTDRVRTKAGTESLNTTGACNTGLTSPTVTKCAIVNDGVTSTPTAGTTVNGVQTGTWVTISATGAASIQVPMQIKP